MCSLHLYWRKIKKKSWDDNFRTMRVCSVAKLCPILWGLMDYSSGRGHGNPLQYSCLEHPMDRGAWRATVHGVAKSPTRLSNNTSSAGSVVKHMPIHARTCRFSPWVGKIPWRTKWQPTPVFLPGESAWTGEPRGLQSVGSQRVGHDWSDLARTSRKEPFPEEH